MCWCRGWPDKGWKCMHYQVIPVSTSSERHTEYQVGAQHESVEVSGCPPPTFPAWHLRGGTEKPGLIQESNRGTTTKWAWTQGGTASKNASGELGEVWKEPAVSARWIFGPDFHSVFVDSPEKNLYKITAATAYRVGSHSHSFRMNQINICSSEA